MLKARRGNATDVPGERLRVLLVLAILCVACIPLVGAAAEASERLAGPPSLAEALSRFEKINLQQMCEEEPFRAAAYLGAAACFEKLRAAVDRADAKTIDRTGRELAARLDLLEGGGLPAEASALLKLLKLAAIPEAQVVVEYPYPHIGSVSFYWGAMPMVGAWVTQFESGQEAAKAFEGEWDARAGFRHEILVAAKISEFGGVRARVSSGAFDYEPVPLGRFAPDKEVCLIAASGERVLFLRVDSIAHTQVEAAVVLEGCPSPVRKTVEEWARAAEVPLVGIADALEKGHILVAGDITTGALGEMLEKSSPSAVKPVLDGYHLNIFDGLQRTSVWGPNREVAEAAARLVLAGEPVKPADVEAIRALLLSQAAPQEKQAAPPEGMAFYSGDLHMHSREGETFPTPVQLALQAMHCFLDYAVFTDHDRIDGVQIADELLKRHGFAYPLTVGEEITTSWAHFNAFPLTEAISPNLSPYETIKAAHRQGAVIQWNHPGRHSGGDSEWSRLHLEKGIGGTGIDAWEGVPANYEAWLEKRTENGHVPVITGATDTHNGTFGALERTIILAPSAHGDDVAEAIRRRQVVALYPNMPRFLYGPNERVASLLWAALADGDAQKSTKAERLKSVLRNADLVGLLNEELPPKPTSPVWE